MPKKVIDLRTFRNGEYVDALSVNNQVDTQALIAILALSGPGDEITIIVKPFDPSSYEQNS